MDDSKMETTSNSGNTKVVEIVDEDTPVRWTYEEVEKYILAKIETYIDDPDKNPMYGLNEDIQKVLGDMNALAEKYSKLQKAMQTMTRDHDLFLSRIGAETRIKTKSVGVGVDLPLLPEMVPTSIANSIRNTSGTYLAQKATPAAKPISKKPAGPVECIDLSSDEETTVPSKPADNKGSGSSTTPAKNVAPASAPTPAPTPAPNQTTHPAPLPTLSLHSQNKHEYPPKPVLKISAANNGIILQWDMPREAKNLIIKNYEIYGYHEKNKGAVTGSPWEKIGFVKAMPLPMSCTLTQFMQGCKYHFSIRAVTINNKPGHFSDPASIMFVCDAKKK